MKVNKGLSLLIGILFIASACQPNQTFLKKYDEEDGALFVYLQPCPEESERLRFSVEEISAIRTDGTEIPLNLHLAEIKGSEMKRQRRLASNYLPEGSYTGLSIKIKRATLKVEEGEAELLIPEAPVKIDFPFSIHKRKAILLSLSFRYSESIRDGINFYPSFTVYIPDRPIVNLTGYVTSYGSDSLFVFDKRASQVTSVILTGRGPKGIALSPTENRAYIALSEDDGIDVIDLPSGEVINRLRLNAGDRPGEILLTPDRKYLLSVNSGSNTVSIIEPNSLIEVERLRVGNEPNSLLIDCRGRKAYVFNRGSNTITILDIPNRAISSTISTQDHGPLRGAINKKCDRLYVFFERSPYMSVIDLGTFSELKKIFVGMGVSALKVDIRTDMLYVGKKYDRRVDIYDPFSLMPIDFIDVKGGVNHITIDDDEKRLYFLLPEKKSLKIIDIVSKRIFSEIDVGEDPFWVSVMGER